MHNMFNQKSRKPKAGSPAAILMRGHHASGGEATPLPQKTKVRSNPSNHYATGGEATPLPQKTRVSSNPSNHYQTGGLSMGRAAPNLSNSFRKGGHPCRKRRAAGGMSEEERQEHRELNAKQKGEWAKTHPMPSMPIRKRATGGALPNLESKTAMHPQAADALRRGGRTKLANGGMSHESLTDLASKMESMMNKGLFEHGGSLPHHLKKKQDRALSDQAHRNNLVHHPDYDPDGVNWEQQARLESRLSPTLRGRSATPHGRVIRERTIELKKGGRARRAPGGAMHDLESKTAMHPQKADALKRGGKAHSPHQKRQKHFAGMLAAALPFLAPIVGSAIGRLINPPQNAKKGGRISGRTRRAPGGRACKDLSMD